MSVQMQLVVYYIRASRLYRRGGTKERARARRRGEKAYKIIPNKQVVM